MILGVFVFFFILIFCESCGLDCTTILFADDTTVYVVVSSVTKIHQTLSSALNNCYDWMSMNLLHLHLQKIKCMLLHSARNHPPTLEVVLLGTRIEPVSCFKFLGVMVNKHLTWENHISSITNKVSRNINLLRHLSQFLPRCALIAFYISYIPSII